MKCWVEQGRKERSGRSSIYTDEIESPLGSMRKGFPFLKTDMCSPCWKMRRLCRRWRPSTKPGKDLVLDFSLIKVSRPIPNPDKPQEPKNPYDRRRVLSYPQRPPANGVRRRDHDVRRGVL